jgi:hypothetical protein
MAAKYIHKFASTAAFLAAAADRTLAAGFGYVSGILYANLSGSAVALVDVSSAQSLTNKTLTAPGVTAQQEIVTATNVILASESGKTFFLNSATEFVSTLPAPAVGLKFKFVVTAAPSGASYTIVGASGTPIHGFVLSKDLNGATDGGATAGTGVLTITLVDSKAQKGDTVLLESDGTDWFAICMTGGNFDAITLS